MSPEEIGRRAQEFQAKVRRRNLEAFAGVIFIAFLGWQGLFARRVHFGERVLSGLIMAAVLYLTWQLYRRRPAGPVPSDAAFAAVCDLYRTELERQREALRRLWQWYTGPMLGAMVAFAVRGVLAHLNQPRTWWNFVPFVVLAVLWSLAMGRVNRRAADKLQNEIDALDVLGEPDP